MRRSIVIFETVVAGLSIVLWGIMLSMSLDITYPSSARFLTGGGSFPFLLCILLILLNVIWIVNNIQVLRKGENDESAQSPLLVYLFGTKQQFRRLVLIAMLVLLYVFALIPLCGKVHPVYGFPCATLIYLIISIKLFGNLNWVKTILTSVIVTGLVFFAMNNMLMLPMPK